MSTYTLVKTGCITVVLLFTTFICKAQPHADFNATPTAGCAPLVVNFSDLSTNNPTQWQWDLGNGTISFLQNPSVTYFNPGQYNVKLVVQNAAGIDSIIKSQYITVYAQPVVNFTGTPLAGCYPLPVQFTDLSTTATGTVSQWQWDFGDGNISSLQNPLHTYTATGNYNVSLMVSNSNGCTRTLTRTSYVQISNGVHADFSTNVSGNCAAPVTINFQNHSTGTGALTYSWNFGDGGTSSLQTPSHNYTNPGTYTVQLIVTNSVGCSDTLIRTNAISIGTVTADFSSPDSVCVNTPFTFTNSSSPIPVTVLWNFGDGTTSTAINPVKFYTAAGNYQVKLVSNFGACIDSITKNIIVLAKPAGAFTGSPLQSCQAPLTVNFTNSSSNAISYQWLFGDGATSAQLNPSHTYTTTGNYTVSLITTNVYGCTDTLIKQDYVKIQLPDVTINDLPQQGCAPFSWTFTATVNSIEPAVSYHWDFGDGGTSTLASPTHIFAPGTYNIQLIITTASGCTDTVTVVNGIRAGTKPVANFNATPRDVCAHLPVNFFDLSTGGATQWLWDFGDGGTATTQNPIHIYEDTGFFTIKLIIWNNGCPDSLVLTDYIHINPPIAAFVAAHDCIEPLKRTFTDQSIGADEWNWDFGDGNTSTLQNPVHIYATPGIYTVTLLVRNHTTGCEYTRTGSERVIIEHAAFDASDTVICRNSPVIFTATGSNAANIASFGWAFGDGGSGMGSPATHSYPVSGLYDVSLLITDINGCKDSLLKIQYIRVNGPAANFGTSTPGSCLLSAINFTDSSATDGIHPIVQWIWNYGDGIIDTLTSGPFQHTYAAPGIYSVSLQITDNSGCTDSIVKASMLTISRPVATYTGDTVSCPGKPVHFINNSQGTGMNYLWDFGDGTTTTDPYPDHVYTTDGIYTIKLFVVDQYGCTDSMVRPNYVRIITALADFTVSDSAGTCPPLIVNFTNTSQNYISLSWDFGDGTSTINPNPSHFYNIPGTYIAKLTITGPGGCISVKQQTITIKGPQGSFTYSPLSGCKPLQVNFIATTQARISFIWDFNDGTTISTTDSVISHTYTIPGTYVPKMILLDAGGCVVPVPGPDTIFVAGITAGISFNAQTICNSGMVQFTNTSVSNDLITGYQWDFGDGTTSTLQNPSHVYDTAGLYYPTLNITTQAGCIDSIRSALPVKIVASPQAIITQSPHGCVPLTVNFNGSLIVADTSALSWDWNLGNGHMYNIQNPSEIYTTGGSYSISMVVTNSSGCKDTVRSGVLAYALPVVDAGVDTMVCKGIGRTLHVTGAASYTWTPSSGLSCSNCADPIATPDSALTYIVTGTNAQGCSNKDSIYVNVQYPFVMNNSPGDTLCKGSSLNLSASGAYSYTWSPSTGLSNATIANPVASPQVSITYQVIGRDDKNCFSDTAYIPVIVYDIPTVEAGADKTINVGQVIDLVPVISSDVTNVIWTPTGSIFRNIYPAVTVKPKETTIYTVTVKNAGGCIATDNLTVYVLCDGANVFIPNTFSPNADGANDIFYPRGTGLFRIKTARVFNRWGEVVYEKSDFQANDPSAGWDGTYKGKPVNTDVYIYVIEIICDNNSLLVYKGNIALIK